MRARQLKSQVYFIQASRTDGDESLAKKAEKIFSKIGLLDKIEKKSFVALKIHFGEKGNTGYIKPPWLSGIIHQIKSRTLRAFVTDSNTLYVGKRSNSVDHLQLASEHGFSLENIGLPVIIADGLIGRDDEEVKVKLSRVKTAKISSVILHSDFLLCLSHLTGHILTGIGGAIKNLGMGCASRAGKLEQHSDVHPRINPKICENCGICLDYCPAQAIVQKEGSAYIQDERCLGCGECLVVCKVGAVRMRWDEDTMRIQEKMAEYAFSVWQKFKEKAIFLNFLIQVTKDCDCMSKEQSPLVEDIGILASADPVAIDKASTDLVIDRIGKDVFRAGYDVDWSVQLEHGAKIGLGSLDYELIEIT